MRLLVIGASGLIGNAVYQLAKGQGIPVIGTATERCGREFVPYQLGNGEEAALFRACNIGKKANGLFVVIAGAVTSIKECYVHPEVSAEINVAGTCKLASMLVEVGARILFLSSDAVFGGDRGNYGEQEMTHPLCVYGRQKVETERYLLAHLNGILIYRLSKQVSADIHEYGGLFGELYRSYKKGERIRCIKGLTFQPTDVMDTANCILMGLQQGMEGLYHVANPQCFTRYELTKLFFHEMGLPANVEECGMEEFSFPEPKALNTTMDTEKFQSVTHCSFRSMKSVIREIVYACIIK